MTAKDVGDIRLANQAWEELLRAQAALARSFTADDIWEELSPMEYDVAFTLSKAKGGLGISELSRRVLLSQPGMSKLVARLENRGLVERRANPEDRREARIVLTRAGTEAWTRVGRKHARAVTAAMNGALGHDQLEQLRDLCRQVTAAIDPELLQKTSTSERNPT